MQSPLIQDGGLNATNSRVGLNTRLLEIDIATGSSREFLYRLDDRANGISEILGINDQEFLVLERDGRAGSNAAFKKLFHISLKGAADISGIGNSAIDGLPVTETPSGVTAVTKTPFLDFLDPAYGLAGPAFPEKLEGLVFGSDLPDGRQLLLAVSDNDFFANNPTMVFAFAVDRHDLPGFLPQHVVPEPSTFLLLLSGALFLPLKKWQTYLRQKTPLWQEIEGFSQRSVRSQPKMVSIPDLWGSLCSEVVSRFRTNGDWSEQGPASSMVVEEVTDKPSDRISG